MVSSVPMNCGDGPLELLVEVQGAADEAHRSHAEAALVERLLGGGDDLRIVREAEVVVGAEVDDLTLRHPDRRALRRGDDTLRA